MSAASDQKLFCEISSAFNCSFDEFVGEKVVSLSYCYAILARPTRDVLIASISLLMFHLIFLSINEYNTEVFTLLL